MLKGYAVLQKNGCCGAQKVINLDSLFLPRNRPIIVVEYLFCPKGEAYSLRFVGLSVRPVPCLANHFKNYCWHLNKTWYIDR